MRKRACMLFLLLSLSLFLCAPPIRSTPGSSDPSTIGDTTEPKIMLVAEYKNGSFGKDLEWDNIKWMDIKRIGLNRADLGSVGFEAKYGCCLWFPPDYKKPLMFIAQRIYGKKGNTHNILIQQDIHRSPFMYENSENITIGWNGTILYGSLEFPVSVAVCYPRSGDRFHYKTNITTPISLDNAGIEYLLYANPEFADNIAKKVSAIRLFYSDGQTNDINLSQIDMNLTYLLPELTTQIGLLTNNGQTVINLFDFGDVFSIAQKKWATIEQLSLFNEQTYVLRIGCAFGGLEANETLVVDPSTVGTSTAVGATRFPFERKTLYANTRAWCFFSNGSHMVYNSSTDGSTWSGDSNPIRACTDGQRFCVVVDDNDNVHYAYASRVAQDDLYYRMGYLESNGSISWLASEQVAVDYSAWGGGQGTGDWYKNPSICINTNGYPWISFTRFDDSVPANPDYGEIVVTNSSTNNGTWTTDTRVAIFYGGGAAAADTFESAMVALNDTQMYAIQINGGSLGAGNIFGRLYNGSAWEPSETIATNRINNGFQYYFSMVATEGDVGVAYHDFVWMIFGADGHDIKFRYRTYGSGWGSVETVVNYDSDTPVHLAPALSTNGSYIWCFYASVPTADHLYYKNRTGGSWGSAVDWIDETTDTFRVDYGHTCYLEAMNSSIGVMYITNATSPYKVRFAMLTGIQMPVVPGDFEAPQYSNITSNQTITNRICLFTSYWTDNWNLSHAIFSWNSSGSWTNDTAYSFGAGVNASWYNVTKTLPSAGLRVGFRFHCNDTSNNWNQTTIQSFEVVLEVTFYHTPTGQFRINCSVVANGTSTTYSNNTLLELAALPYNASWLFNNFTYTLEISGSGTYTTNPNNHTLINQSQTLWCNFAAADGGIVYVNIRGEYIAALLIASFILVPISILIIWLIIRRRR